MTLIYSIEGNIGSGKSTLVNLLNENLLYINDKQLVFLQEPVDIWNTVKDENEVTILEKFYDNQEKYAFSFQMMAYISRIHLLKKTIVKFPNCIIITERSVFTDKNVFAKMLYDDKKIEEVNYQIYLKWFDEFIKDVPLTGIIYIQTTPEKSLERINIRARKGEKISLEYLQKCNDYHDNWIGNENTALLTIDGNIEFNAFPPPWYNEIITFIKTFSPKQSQVNMQKLTENAFC